MVALGGGKVALKSGYDRYVGTSLHGKLTGYKEAIDTLETWTAEVDEVRLGAHGDWDSAYCLSTCDYIIELMC